MGLTISGAGKEFESVPNGLHPARCIGVVDLGHQHTPFFNDDGTPKIPRQLRLMFELLGDQKREDGKAFIVSKDFTSSLHEKANLRPFLESWRGKPFTPEELEAFSMAKLAGAYATIQIMNKKTKKGNDYADITNALPLTTTPKPEGINEVLVLDLDEFNQDVFDKLPKFIQEKIMSSLTWAQMNKEDKSFKASDVPVDSEEDLPPPDKQDTVIEDIGDEPINLDDIPF